MVGEGAGRAISGGVGLVVCGDDDGGFDVVIGEGRDS